MSKIAAQYRANKVRRQIWYCPMDLSAETERMLGEAMVRLDVNKPDLGRLTPDPVLLSQKRWIQYPAPDAFSNVWRTSWITDHATTEVLKISTL